MAASSNMTAFEKPLYSFKIKILKSITRSAKLFEIFFRVFTNLRIVIPFKLIKHH